MINNNLLNLIKKLRIRTGIGIVECKKALLSAKGNIELAIDNLRKLGMNNSLIKSERLALEGSIFIFTLENIGAILELNCETDFVSRNKQFCDFGENIVKTAVIEKINDLNQIKSKFQDSKMQLISVFSENIIFRRFLLFKGNNISSYRHLNRIGVLVDFKNCKNKRLSKELAMHIAASKPRYLKSGDVPQSILERERKVQLDLAINSGKSMIIAEKIVFGRMKKFLKEICLLEQDFILDPKITIKDLSTSNSFSIESFVRFEIGDSNYC